MSDQTASNAKKSFGQNFLVDRNYISKIARTARIEPGEIVVEIGPGRGAITEELVSHARKVIAIELDRDLIPGLREKFNDSGNFILLSANALRVDFSELSQSEGSKLKLVANLPYYISTAILQHLIAHRSAFSEMLLMFQREVADRITAGPGDAERGYLTVLVEGFLTVEKIFDVPPTAFRPAPRVWSSVVRLTPGTHAAITRDREIAFTRLVSAAFRQKRKTISNNLKNAGPDLTIPDPLDVLADAGIEPKRRAESLTIIEWKRLTDSLVNSTDL